MMTVLFKHFKKLYKVIFNFFCVNEKGLFYKNQLTEPKNQSNQTKPIRIKAGWIDLIHLALSTETIFMFSDGEALFF